MRSRGLVAQLESERIEDEMQAAESASARHAVCRPAAPRPPRPCTVRQRGVADARRGARGVGAQGAPGPPARASRAEAGPSPRQRSMGRLSHSLPLQRQRRLAEIEQRKAAERALEEAGGAGGAGGGVRGAGLEGVEADAPAALLAAVLPARRAGSRGGEARSQQKCFVNFLRRRGWLTAGGAPRGAGARGDSSDRRAAGGV